jgi:hypothetical protein
MSEEFRVAARARLMRRIAPEQVEPHAHAVGQNGHISASGTRLTTVPSRSAVSAPPRRGLGWLWRGGLGGLLGAALIAAATVTASASALPGEPLYGVKQAREELGVRLAPDDGARTLALLNLADARLDETTRLLEQGRTDQVASTTQRFDDALGQATTSYVVTIAEAQPSDPTTSAIESTLTRQQEELQNLLDSAPEPTRADLREALVATQRSRALVADPKPADVRSRAANRPAVAEPTQALEVEPTPRVAEAPPSAPPPVDLVAEPTQAPIADSPGRHEGRGIASMRDEGQAPVQVEAPTVVVANRGRGSGRPASARQDARLQDVQVPSGPAVAVEEHADGGTGPADQAAGDGSGLGPGHAADARSDGNDRVVAPSPDPKDARGRVAQQSSPQNPPTVGSVAQHPTSSDGDGGGGARGSVGTAAAQSSNSNGGGRGGAARAAEDARAGAPNAAMTAVAQVRAQATQSQTGGFPDERRTASSGGGSDSSVSSGGGSATNSGPLRQFGGGQFGGAQSGASTQSSGGGSATSSGGGSATSSSGGSATSSSGSGRDGGTRGH